MTNFRYITAITAYILSLMMAEGETHNPVVADSGKNRYIKINAKRQKNKKQI